MDNNSDKIYEVIILGAGISGLGSAYNLLQNKTETFYSNGNEYVALNLNKSGDIIDPETDVPTVIGAVAYLDRLEKFLGLSDHQKTSRKMIELQKEYWPEAKRTFNPIDIEYLSCECR